MFDFLVSVVTQGCVQICVQGVGSSMAGGGGGGKLNMLGSKVPDGDLDL